MNETRIKLVMDNQNDITVTNMTNNNNFVILYSDKTIAALSIYQLLSYQLNTTYVIDSNVTDIIEEKINAYYSDIIELFDDITKEISDMAEINDEELEETEVETDFNDEV